MRVGDRHATTVRPSSAASRILPTGAARRVVRIHAPTVAVRVQPRDHPRFGPGPSLGSISRSALLIGDADQQIDARPQLHRRSGPISGRSSAGRMQSLHPPSFDRGVGAADRSASARSGLQIELTPRSAYHMMRVVRVGALRNRSLEQRLGRRGQQCRCFDRPVAAHVARIAERDVPCTQRIHLIASSQIELAQRVVAEHVQSVSVTTTTSPRAANLGEPIVRRRPSSCACRRRPTLKRRQSSLCGWRGEGSSASSPPSRSGDSVQSAAARETAAYGIPNAHPSLPSNRRGLRCSSPASSR